MSHIEAQIHNTWLMHIMILMAYQLINLIHCSADLPQDINIYSAKVDYTLPLKKGAKFEAGLKTSFVETDNNAIYDSVNYGHKSSGLWPQQSFYL